MREKTKGRLRQGTILSPFSLWLFFFFFRSSPTTEGLEQIRRGAKKGGCCTQRSQLRALEIRRSLVQILLPATEWIEFCSRINSQLVSLLSVGIINKFLFNLQCVCFSVSFPNWHRLNFFCFISIQHIIYCA